MEVCLLFLGALLACDPDENNFLRVVDAKSGVLHDEVRFGVLLIDLITIPVEVRQKPTLWAGGLRQEVP